MNAITALLINNRNLRKKLQLSKILLPHYLFLIKIIVEKGIHVLCFVPNREMKPLDKKESQSRDYSHTVLTFL